LSLIYAEREKKSIIEKRYMFGSLEQLIMPYLAKSSGKEEIEKGI
jgi:hypothetical protein